MSSTSSTLDRALQVIDCLYNSSEPQSITQISKTLEFSPSSVHRFLATFKKRGLIFQSPETKLYSLGFMFLNYSNKVFLDLNIYSMIDPWLRKLRDETQETVGFYVTSGLTRICMLEHESPQEIRRSVGVGKTYPLHLGATGRSILAFQPENIKKSILENLPIEEQVNIENKLEITKKKLYSINDDEEISTQVGAISIPIFDHAEQIVGAVSISGPLFRWKKETMLPYIPLLLETSKQITNSFRDYS